jgi:hypothetical protein
MGLENFTAGIDFRVLQPEHRRDPRGRFALERRSGRPAVLLELIGAPFDAVNTTIRPAGVHSALRPLLDVPRMSTMAIGAVLNLAVASMPPGQAFVNVGTWHGYTLLAAMAGNPDALCVGIDDFSEHGGPREEFNRRFERFRTPRHSFHDMDYRDYLAGIHEGPIGVYLYDGEDSYEAELEALRAGEPFFAGGCLVMADDTNRGHRRRAMFDFAEQSPHEYSVVLDAHTAANRHPTFWKGTLVLRRSDGGRGEEPHVVGHESVAPPDPAPHPEPGSSVTVVLLADSDGRAAAEASERVSTQTWRDVELLVADCSAHAVEPAVALRKALDRSSGDLVAFVDVAADLRPDAVELSLAYPQAARFPHGRIEDELLERLQRGLAAGADVDSVLSPGTPFLYAGDHHGLPETISAGPATPLAGPGRRLRDLGDDALAQAIAAARQQGTRHLVVLWMRFEWLDGRPAVGAQLAEHASTLLANERVRVYALDGPA